MNIRKTKTMSLSKIEKLQDDLNAMFDQACKDRRMIPQAVAAGNIAREIINSYKLEVDYRAAKIKDPSFKIDFMEAPVAEGAE